MVYRKEARTLKSFKLFLRSDRMKKKDSDTVLLKIGAKQTLVQFVARCPGGLFASLYFGKERTLRFRALGACIRAFLTGGCPCGQHGHPSMHERARATLGSYRVIRELSESELGEFQTGKWCTDRETFIYLIWLGKVYFFDGGCKT